MSEIRIMKRGKVYQYRFEIASRGGVRRYINKSGFESRKEAQEAGAIAYNEYFRTGRKQKIKDMSYEDYLDYWMINYCYFNVKYATISSYLNIIKNHLKPELGMYKLTQLDSYTIQNYINKLYKEKHYSKHYLKGILKLIKGSLKYACYTVNFINDNPAERVHIPKYDVVTGDPAHIFSQEEFEIILDRFKEVPYIYYSFLTAYYTGLRVSECYGLTWDNIDFEKKTLTVNKNIIKKNQNKLPKKYVITKGHSVEEWYYGTCKNPQSNRTIAIGDTLVKALKEYKKEQEEYKKFYGESYLKHYEKEVINPFTERKEIKIVNAPAELELNLPESKLIFVKPNGQYRGTETPRHAFKVINYELKIPCRFHDFRDTHATRLIEQGADIKAVSKRLGHSSIMTTYNIYVRVTDKMETETVDKFENYTNTLDIPDTKEQILHATVHMDEKTPHIHCVVIPLVKKLDKRSNTERYTISKKQYIHDKNHLSELQDKYCDRLNKAGFDLERGIKNSDTEHIAIKEFKKVTRSLDNQLEVRNQKLDNAINELEENMKSNKSVMFDKDSVKIKKETFDSMNKVIDESKKLNELKPKMKKVIDNMEYYTSNYKKTYNENNRLNKEINGLNIKVEELETKQTALEQTLHTLRVIIREVMDFLVSIIEKGLLPQKEKEYCKKNFGDYMFYKPKQVYREKPQKDKDDDFCL